MPSKKVPYKNILKFSAELESNPVAYFLTPDCFSEKVVLDTIKKTYHKVQGEELTVMWLEDNVLSAGLFGDIGPVMVLNSDKISKKVFEFLNEVSFSKETSLKFLSSKKITNKDFLKRYQQVILEAPKFWSLQEYIDVFAKHFSVSLNSDVKTLLMGILPGTAEAYFNALMILSSYEDDLINPQLVRAVFKQSALDNFELANHLNVGNMKKLFYSLLVIENDFEVYRSFFSFIQGHMIKILDPSYTQSKAKLSKYDQAIISASRSWNRVELLDLLESFSKLEIMAKSKKSELRDVIRLSYLRTIS